MIRQGNSYRLLLSGVAVLVLLTILAIGPSQVFALDLQSKADIIDLMLCYGTGTDAIGDSTRADPAGDGAAVYARCFTDDAPFSVWFPGTPFSGPPTNPPTIGPAAWAASVFSTFTDRGYTFTQHSLSNFLVEVRGDTGTKTGTLTAYLNAAHVKHSGGAVTGVDVAHGTYTLQVEQVQGAWKVKALALKLLTFTPFAP
jgi:hypothetical protein